MICGYARVSTKLQEREGNSLEAQEQQLKAAGARIVFTESFTGATLDRPQLNELRKALEAGDTLMITKLDRLARSASQGITFIEDLLSHGISVRNAHRRGDASLVTMVAVQENTSGNNWSMQCFS